jgi:hypothetical protein
MIIFFLVSEISVLVLVNEEGFFSRKIYRKKLLNFAGFFDDGGWN